MNIDHLNSIYKPLSLQVVDVFNFVSFLIFTGVCALIGKWHFSADVTVVAFRFLEFTHNKV